jgi:3-hydroxymyristoyl/3-hydroxydecanoyl-(acyl carrier protein) dehydratase
MPGVLMLEALAQAAALLSFESLGTEPDETRWYYFAGIDGARFKRPVEPGRPAHPRGQHRPRQGRHLQVPARASVDGETGGRGRADVHHAQGRLSAMATIHPTAIVDPRAELAAA